jgi:hypothetical protein
MMTPFQSAIFAIASPLIVVGIWRAVFILVDIRDLLKHQGKQ